MAKEKDYDAEFAKMYLDAMAKLADDMTDKAAIGLAQIVIDSVERDLTNPIAVARKPYIYWKVIQVLQQKLESISGEMRIEE